ncbi:hypothetical protein [Bradyrhizobium sp. S3.9.1]|uniref:hypothetical protein n=1 Tax=Bradyrhizobium sp. S3.9.1 TaxID=3156431 RepID=UPI003397C0DF
MIIHLVLAGDLCHQLHDLLADVDAAATELERDAMTVLQDFQQRFWLLQRARHLDLPPQHCRDLFEAWRARQGRQKNFLKRRSKAPSQSSLLKLSA